MDVVYLFTNSAVAQEVLKNAFLKVSEVMRAEGVCGAVYLPFRSDLANQMLVLKCAQTQGAFADRRPEVVHSYPSYLRAQVQENPGLASGLAVSAKDPAPVPEEGS